MEETAETRGESLAHLIDKLASKGSDLELNFKNLTLEVAEFKAKLNESIVLSILYASEK